MNSSEKTHEHFVTSLLGELGLHPRLPHAFESNSGQWFKLLLPDRLVFVAKPWRRVASRLARQLPFEVAGEPCLEGWFRVTNVRSQILDVLSVKMLPSSRITPEPAFASPS